MTIIIWPALERPRHQPSARIPDPRQVTRLLRIWVAGYRSDGTPIHEADVVTDSGAFTTARLIGGQWEVQGE